MHCQYGCIPAGIVIFTARALPNKHINMTKYGFHQIPGLNMKLFGKQRHELS